MFGYVCRYAVHCNSTVPQEQRAGYIALGERNEAQAQAARGRRLKQILMMIIEADDELTSFLADGVAVVATRCCDRQDKFTKNQYKNIKSIN
jgi:hypothetical protein